jgi:PAS domain S-box-containing protein
MTIIVGTFVVAITTIVAVSLYKLEARNYSLGARTREKAAEISRLQILNQRIIDVASDGIIAADLNDQIVSCNPAARNLLHLINEKSISISPHSLFHQGNPCNEECPIYLAVHQSAEDNKLLELVIDGNTVILEVSVRALDGPEAGYVIIFHDITSRTLLSRTKEHIISVVSHEIRTPLTTIKGSLGLLKSGQFGTISDESEKLLALAIENSDRLMILVNDLLDLEKIEAKRNHLNIQKFFIDDLIAQSTRQISMLSSKKKITISASTEHEEILADRDRLLQVITNLLHNAVKFSPENSMITIDAFFHDGEYIIQVKDEGIGLPDNQLTKVFEPFTQLAKIDSRTNDGSGLGLSICQGIVESHGGRIKASNRFPRGSVFEFSVPHILPDEHDLQTKEPRCIKTTIVPMS